MSRSRVFIGNARGLRRVLDAYVEYDERSRTHLSLDKDAPIPAPSFRPAKVASWRLRRSAASITDTDASRPDPTHLN
jgi:hypothetical protein